MAYREKSAVKRLTALFAIFFAGFWLLAGVPVQAAQLASRSIQVSTARPSAVADHLFQFTIVSTSTLGSVVFEYCENSALIEHPCTPPAGFDASTAALSAQSGNLGFSIDTLNSTTNKIVLTRTAAAALAVASSYTFSGVINPSAAASTEFVRITTYASTDGSGAYTDNGSVAFATVTPLSVGAYVPPYLKFCVGLTVAVDCSSMAGNSIDLGTLGIGQAGEAQSQFATGTNDSSGYSVYSLGTTMTSGNNTIPALAVPTPSLPGVSQFGINLRDNTSPQIGEDPVGPGTASPAPDYNNPDFYTFRPGDSITASANSTDFDRMTVSYVVNVSATQPVGVYSTTITYLAVASF